MQLWYTICILGSEELDNLEHSYITITPRSTLTRNGTTYSSSIYRSDMF